MSASASVERTLCELAQRAVGVREYREGVLACLAPEVRFDGALYHELSPRVSLDRAALRGIDRSVLEASLGGWDENAALFARLRELALERDGVATDTDAFAAGTRSRKRWDERVAKPFRARATLAAHLIVRDKLIAAVMLFRRNGPAFSARDQAAVRALIPVLSVGDALQQALASKQLAGPAVKMRCVDQRLTPRQREIVEHVALGHTNGQIGEALGVSPNTIRNLLTEVRQRLSAANRAEIVRVAVLR